MSNPHPVHWIWGCYNQGHLQQRLLAVVACILTGGILLIPALARRWPRFWLLLWYKSCCIEDATTLLVTQTKRQDGKEPKSFICHISTLSFKPQDAEDATPAPSLPLARLFRSLWSRQARLQPKLSARDVFYNNPLHSQASASQPEDLTPTVDDEEQAASKGPYEPDIHVVEVQSLRYQVDKRNMLLVPTEETPPSMQRHICEAVKALANGCAPQPMTHTERAKMTHIYGNNRIAVPTTHWAILLCVAFFHPLYLFQLYAVALWIYYEYVEYSVLVCVFAMTAVIVNVVVQHRQSSRLKQVASNHGTVSLLTFPDGDRAFDYKSTLDSQQDLDAAQQGGWREVCAPLARRQTHGALSRAVSKYVDLELLRSPTKAGDRKDKSFHSSQDGGDGGANSAGAMNLMSAIKQTMAWVESGSAEELVAGDLVLIDQAEIPADMILLQGEVVVDESVITGENVPMNRTSIQPTYISALNYVEIPASCRLLSGTKVIVASGAQSKPCIAMVTHTGFSSVKGRLVHTMIHSENGIPSMLKQSSLLIVVLLGIGLGFYGWNIKIFKSLGLDNHEIALRAADIITVAVPPALVMCLMLMTTTMLFRLKKHNVAVEDAKRIPLAGVVDVVCLDKTGTITDPDYLFSNILPVVDGLPGHSVTQGRHAPLEFKVLMAACHGLVIIGDAVRGHPLDLALYQASGWSLQQDGMDVMGDGKQRRPSVSLKQPAELEDEDLAAEMADSVANLISQVPVERFQSAEFSRPGSGLSADFSRPGSGLSRDGSNPWLVGATNDRPFGSPVCVSASNLRPARRMFTDPGCPMPEDGAAPLKAVGLPRRVMFQIAALTPRSDSKEDMHHKPDMSESSASSARLNWNDNFLDSGPEPAYPPVHAMDAYNFDSDDESPHPPLSNSSPQPKLPPGRKSINLFAEAHMAFVTREHMLDVRSDTTRRIRMAGTMSMNGAAPSASSPVGPTSHRGGPKSTVSVAPRSTMSVAAHHAPQQQQPASTPPQFDIEAAHSAPPSPRLLLEEPQRPSFATIGSADHTVDPLLGLLSSKVRNVLTPMASPLGYSPSLAHGRHSSSPGAADTKTRNWTLSKLIETARTSLSGGRSADNSPRSSTSRQFAHHTPTRNSNPLASSSRDDAHTPRTRLAGYSGPVPDGTSRQPSEGVLTSHPSEFMKQLTRFRNSSRRPRLPSNIQVGSAQGMMRGSRGARCRSNSEVPDNVDIDMHTFFAPAAPPVVPATEEPKLAFFEELRGSMLRDSKNRISLQGSFNSASMDHSHPLPTVNGEMVAPGRHSRLTARSTNDRRNSLPLFQTTSGRMTASRPSQEMGRPSRVLQLTPDIAKSGRTSRASRPSHIADKSTSRASMSSAQGSKQRSSNDSSSHGLQAGLHSIAASLMSSERQSPSKVDSAGSRLARAGSVLKQAAKLTFNSISSKQRISSAGRRSGGGFAKTKTKLAPRAPDIMTIKTTNMWTHPGQGVPDTYKFKIVQRFPFTSADQRCTVVVEQPGGDLVVYIKGAPEKMAEICDARSLPGDFEAMVHAACQPGCMVLGAAIKHMPNARAEHIVLFDRVALEAGAEFIGLITLSNTLRHGAIDVVQEIMSVGMQAVMVTGDSLRSGTQVALQLGMLPSNLPVIALEHAQALDSDERHIKSPKPNRDLASESVAPGLWESAARAAESTIGPNNKWIDSLFSFKLISSNFAKNSQSLDAQTAFRMLSRRRAGLVVTGAAFSLLLTSPTQTPLLRLVLKQAIVYARMLPPLKKELVSLLGHPPSKPFTLPSFTSCLSCKPTCKPACFQSSRRKRDVEIATQLMNRNRYSQYGGPIAEGVEGPWGQQAPQEEVEAEDMVFHGDTTLYQCLTVAFCGDGANDLAALKAATVGLSVSGAAGTLAATISIPPENGLDGLKVVLSEGRTSAINMITVFQFIMVYAFAQLLNVAMLYSIGLEPAQYQYLMQDLFYTTLTAVGMGLTKPSTKLPVERATMQFVSVPVLLPVVAQFMACTGSLFGVKYMLASEPWFQALGGPLDLPTETAAEGSMAEDAVSSPLSPAVPPVLGMELADLLTPPSPDLEASDAPSSELDYDYVPLLDEDYSITRPETGIITIVALATMLGAGLAFSLYNRSARQRVLRNYVLMTIWVGQAVFVLYLACAPGNAFKRYGPRGPGVADFPASFRWKLGLLVVGTVVCQFLLQLLVTTLMASRLWRCCSRS